MDILQVQELTKEYGEAEGRVTALAGLTFSVEKGQFIAIVGPSGSGKSTLMHILGGVDRPTSGKVFLDGEDVFAMKEDALAVFRRRQIGLVYQFYNLIPVLNVEENLTLPLLLDGRAPNPASVAEMLSTLSMTQRAAHLPSQLSGGQQQRVSIGRALITSPALVLADEPTGNLDSKNSKEVMALLHRFNRELGQTVIVITHDEQIALGGDRVLTLEDGRLVRDEVLRR